MSRDTVFVTGATGLVGFGLVERLLAKGERVRALVRDPRRAQGVLPGSVQLAPGDVTLPETLAAPMRDARLVFHAAGMPEQWQRDETIFDRVNRDGTKNVLEAALAAGVPRVVYTSTMDVFAAPRGGMLSEAHVDANPKPTAYERSKQAAEAVANAIAERGLDIVLVNPGAVYGPSPALTGLNAFFVQLLKHEVPVLPPGGLPIAFVDGVADAHLAAAGSGKRGERYLVADEHRSMRALAAEILEAAGGHRKAPSVAPAWALRALAGASAFVARRFDVKPLIAPGELSFLLWNVSVDASKAERELGFERTPARTGIRRTVQWLLSSGLVRAQSQ
jgi:nucleoside-diphosphate-sugar epimerase